MITEDLNLEIYEEVSEVKSNDPAFLDMQKKILEYRDGNLEYFSLLDSQKRKADMRDFNGKPVEPGQLEYFFKPRYYLRNIELRNEFNIYFEANKDKATSVEYQAMVKAYNNLVLKCNEDEKEFGRDNYFKVLYQAYDDKIINPKGDSLTEEMLGRSMAARYYIASLEREYNAAAEIMEKGTEAEKEEAKKWQDEIISSLYSGKFEDNLNNFINNHPVGKCVYRVSKKSYSSVAAEGVTPKYIGIIQTELASELNKVKYGLMDVIDEIKTIDDGKIEKEQLEANRAKALEYVYQIEELCDIYHLASGKTDLVTFDGYDYKLSRELVGSFDDKILPIKRKLYKEFMDKALADVDKEIADQEQVYKDIMKKKGVADSTFHTLEKELEQKRVRFQKAKDNYEKISKNSTVYDNDLVANEEIFKFQEKEYKDIYERYGDAATKASNLSRQAEAIKNKLDQLKANRDNKFREINKNNPYVENSNKFIERGTHDAVEETLDNGEKYTRPEIKSPADVKVTRVMMLLDYLKVGAITLPEYMQLMTDDEKNIELLHKARKPLTVKRTVKEGIEPGLAALEARNKQSSGEAPVVNKIEEPVNEEININNVEDIKEEAKEEKQEEKQEEIKEAPQEEQIEEPDIDYSSIRILEEARAKVNKPVLPPNPSFGEAHQGIVSLDILADAVATGNKGVWFGSKQFDEIVKGMKAIKETENALDLKSNIMDGDKLKERREALYDAKKQLSLQMKYYLKRKNAELKTAQDNNKAENSNSTMRRELITEVKAIFDEHIAADEKAFGLDENRDRFFEDVNDEIKYLYSVDKKNPELKDLYNYFGKYIKDKPEEMTSQDRIDGMVGAYKQIILAARQYKDKKPNPVKEALFELAEKVGNRYLKEVAEYRPDRLEDLKEQFKDMNKKYGINVDTNIDTPEKSANSYDQIIAHNAVIIKDQSKTIYKTEFNKKKEAEELVLYIDNQEEDGFVVEFDQNEKKALNQIRQSAYHTIFADIQKSKGVIFNPIRFEMDAGQFRTDMKNTYGNFHKAFGANLTQEFSLKGKAISGDNAFKFEDIDLSLDALKQIKDKTFKEIVVKEMTKLGTAAKNNADKAEIENGLAELNKLNELSKAIGSEGVYNSTIEVEGKEVTVKHLEDIVKAKAQKALSPAKAENQKQNQNDKQPVKPQGMNK